MKLLVSKLCVIIFLFSITVGQQIKPIKQDQNLPKSNQVERLKLRIRLSRQKLVELRQKISKLLAQHKNAKVFKIRLNVAQSALNRLLIKKILARRKVNSVQRKYLKIKLHKIRLRKLRSLRKLKTLRIKRRQRAIGVHKVLRQHPLLRSSGLFRINREILFTKHRITNLYRRLAYLLRLRNSKFFSRFGARRNLCLRRRLRPRIFRRRRCARRRFKFPRHNCRFRTMRMLRLLRSVKQKISTRNRNRKVISAHRRRQMALIKKNRSRKYKGRTRIVNKKTNTLISKKKVERYLNRSRRATKNKIPLSCKEFQNKQFKYMAQKKVLLAKTFKSLYEKCIKNNKAK